MATLTMAIHTLTYMYHEVRNSWRDLARAGRLPSEALPAAVRLLRTEDLPGAEGQLFAGDSSYVEST